MRFSPLHAVALLAAVPSVAAAHHGWATYDTGKPVTIEGPLTDVRWANPHGAAKISWKGQEWIVLLAPIARMENRGLTADMLKPGRPVTVIGQPRSDGTREIKIERITVDKKTYELRA